MTNNITVTTAATIIPSERRSKRPSTRPALQIYRPPGKFLLKFSNISFIFFFLFLIAKAILMFVHTCIYTDLSNLYIIGDSTSRSLYIMRVRPEILEVYVF